MYKGPIKNYLNVNNFVLTPAVLQKAIVLSGLRWGITPAQYFAMQTWGFIDPVVAQTEVKDNSVVTSLKCNNDTLLGLPLELDDSLPRTTVQLRYQGAVLYEIQNLAVPYGFEEPSA